MYLWGFLCFLSAFATIGNCLQCITCSTDSTGSCSSTNSESCLDGQVCASQSTITMKDGVISQHFKRLCAPQSECSVYGTFSYYLTTERIATTCCFKDLCSSEMPVVPSSNSTINGVICSKCTLSGDACGADQIMNCTGDETMCLLMSTKDTIGVQTTLSMVRGCVSSGYCVKNSLNFTSDEVHTEITYQCTTGMLTNSNTTTSGTCTTTTTMASSGNNHCSVSLLAVFFFFILLLLI
ncbi:uncharacterized protein [Phyllobates terribilis]|uniref:uncharacterized protein n=1 Tax=Phyllobates terribilis TaxID=111132 RepID=UPI003CCA7727